MNNVDNLVSQAAAGFRSKWQIPNFDRYDAVFNSLGYPMETIYKKLGIDTVEFSEIQSGIFAEDFLNIFKEIIYLTNDSCVGVKLGTMRPVKKIGTRFYIAFFSKTLRSALNDFLFYSSLEIPFLKIKMEEGKSETKILFEYDIDNPSISFEFDVDLIAIVNLIRELLLRPEWAPKSASSRYQLASGRSDALAALVHCPLDKNAGRNSIIFSSDILDVELKFSDPLAKSIMIGAFYSRLNSMYADYSYVSRTNFFLARYFDCKREIPKLSYVASSFNMSISAYQRELIKEGVSFRKIKSDLLFKLAKCLLADGLNYVDASKMLGYATSHSLIRFLDSYNE